MFTHAQSGDDTVFMKAWVESPENIESGAWEQIKNLKRLPFAHHHVAIMSDVHQGYGVPIGGVLACDGVVIPAAVGVDIGCGVIAVSTNIASIGGSETLKTLLRGGT